MNMTNEQLTFVEESQNLRKQVRQKAFKKYFTQFKWPFVSVCFILLFVVCASYLYALYWGIITSLKDILDFNENMFGLPQRIKFTNYGTAFRKLYYTIQTPTGRVRIMFPNLLFNSIVFAVVMPTVSKNVLAAL